MLDPADRHQARSFIHPKTLEGFVGCTSCRIAEPSSKLCALDPPWSFCMHMLPSPKLLRMLTAWDLVVRIGDADGRALGICCLVCSACAASRSGISVEATSCWWSDG